MTTDTKLKKVYDESVMTGLFNGAKDAHMEVFIWKLVGGSKYLANVKIEAVRKTRKDLCVVPAPGYEKQVQELMGSQEFIDFYIPESALLFRCKIRQTEAPVRYYVCYPEFTAQVERRKEFRLNVHDSAEVKVGFSKSTIDPRPMTQVFTKTCFDVSAGGFSFLVSRMESKFFKIHDPIRNIDVKIGDRKAKVNAEIALIKEIEPDQTNGLTYKVWRVCCRFSQIDHLTEKHIQRFILERIKDDLHVING